MVETLLLAAALALAAAIVYGVVGRNVQRRPVSERNALANTMFAVWWYSLGLSTALTGGLALAFYAGQRDVSMFFTAALLNILFVCVALWALLYYLIFLFTGNRNILAPLSVGYTLYFFFLVYFLIDQGPQSVISDGWTARVQYSQPNTGWLYGVVIVLTLFPQILGALALLSFAFRLKDLERRVRVAVVGTSIIVWFGIAFVGLALGISQTTSWQAISRFIGLMAALAILAAYRPPAFMRGWFARHRANQARTPGSAESPGASEESRSFGRSTPSGTAW